MQDAKRITRALSRLLATFPTFASGDGRTALEVYYEVISDHDAADIEHVVKLFINGLVEGQSLIYLPTAPMFAQAILNTWHGTSVSSLFETDTLVPIYEGIYQRS